MCVCYFVVLNYPCVSSCTSQVVLLLACVSVFRCVSAILVSLLLLSVCESVCLCRVFGVFSLVGFAEILFSVLGRSWLEGRIRRFVLFFEKKKK